MGGLDARAASLGLGAAGCELVAGLQQAGQAILAFRTLQAVDAPLASLVLGADPDTAAATQGELATTIPQKRAVSKNVTQHGQICPKTGPSAKT